MPAAGAATESRRPRRGQRVSLLMLGTLVVPVAGAEAPKNGIPLAALRLTNFEYPDPSVRATMLPPTNATTKKGTFRNDFCAASDRVLHAREVSLDRALEGWALTTALLDSGDLATYDFDDEGNVIGLNADYPGLMPLILDELCERSGCTWRDSFAYVPKTFPNNETFSDLLKWTTDVYDISVNFWSRSIERLEEGASFIESWYDGSIIMIALREPVGSDSFDPWGWLAPFDYSVWLMILLTLFFSTVVHWLIEVVFKTNGDSGNSEDEFDPSGNDENRGSLWDRLQPWETLWRFATTFAGQFEFEPTTPPAYLFTFSVAFWALLMGAAYTANLASFLVSRNHTVIPVNTVEDAVHRGSRLCVAKGSQQDLSVSESFPSYADGGRLIRIAQSTDDRKVLESLKAGHCDIAITEAAAWDIFQRDETLNGDCNLEWVGRPLLSIPASFAVKSDAGTLCTSFLRDIFNVHLIRMEIEGVLDDLWEEHINRFATVDCNAGGADTATSASETRRRRRKLKRHNKQHNEGQEEETSLGINMDASSSSLRPSSTTLCATSKNKNEQQLPRRHLSASKSGRGGAAAGGAAVASTNDGNEKLSLTNMGGVFLLHGLLSAIAVLAAATSWAWKRGYLAQMLGPALAHPYQQKNDSISSNSTTAAADECGGLGITRTNQSHHHYHDKHEARLAKQHADTHHHAAHHHDIIVASLQALREDLGRQLSTVELRLSNAMKEQYNEVEERLNESMRVQLSTVETELMEAMHDKFSATGEIRYTETTKERLEVVEERLVAQFSNLKEEIIAATFARIHEQQKTVSLQQTTGVEQRAAS